VFRIISVSRFLQSRYPLPRGLGVRSVTDRLLRLWVRILPGRMDVCFEFCLSSCRSPCDDTMTRPDRSLPRVVLSFCVI
jgi:hypothetical protein